MYMSIYIYIYIQCVPFATEPGISLIILTPMKILQRNLNRSTFVVWEMKRNVSVVCVCSAPNCYDTDQRSASQPGSVASGTHCIFDIEKARVWRLFPTNTSYIKHLIRFVVHCSFEESGSTLATFLVFMKHKGVLQRTFPRIYPEQMNSIFFLTPRLFAIHFHVGFPSTTMSRSFLLFGGINVSLVAWYTFVFWFSCSLNAISLFVYTALMCVLSQTHTKPAYSQTYKRTK